jgi:hypothetical protein
MQGHNVTSAERRSPTRMIAIFFTAAVTAGIAGLGFVLHSGDAADDPLPDALSRTRVPGDAVPDRLAAPLRRAGFDMTSTRRVATQVYLARRDGGLCVVSVVGNELPFGCMRAGGFFNGHQIFFTISEDGRPTNPTLLRIDGVARAGVASVRVSFGSLARSVAVTADGGFSYTADPEALAMGEPTLLEAMDASSRVLERLPGPPS